jgi:ABC-type sugar transport system permease subunit
VAFGKTPVDWLNSGHAFFVMVTAISGNISGITSSLDGRLAAIPESYYEAARVDGARRSAEVFLPSRFRC